MPLKTPLVAAVPCSNYLPTGGYPGPLTAGLLAPLSSGSGVLGRKFVASTIAHAVYHAPDKRVRNLPITRDKLRRYQAHRSVGDRP